MESVACSLHLIARSCRQLYHVTYEQRTVSITAKLERGQYVAWGRIFREVTTQERLERASKIVLLRHYGGVVNARD